MARDFNGTNERISFGSDASIDGFTQLSVAAWFRRDVLNAGMVVACKDRTATGWLLIAKNDVGSNRLEFGRNWTTANGEWQATDTPISTSAHHVVVVYDGGSTLNDPTIYIDGVSQTIAESSAPSGTLGSDAAQSLLIGENGAGAADLNGAVQHLTYASGLWTAAQVNMHRWWGRVGGSVEVHHPLLTTKLTNEGTATADGTATGTTMTSLPRVERCWGSMMGCGR